MKKVLLSDSGPETSDSIYSFWRWENGDDYLEDDDVEYETAEV